MINDELFNKLYKKYKQFVKSKLFQLHFDAETKKDISQDYFLAIVRRIERGDITENDKWESYKMKLYLGTVLKEWILKHNAQKRQMQNTAISLSTKLSDLSHTSSSNGGLLSDYTIDINIEESDSELIKIQLNEVLYRNLFKLKDIELDYIDMYYFKGCVLGDIAEKYGKTKQSVSLRLGTIREKLKKHLPNNIYYNV
jgi:RNA polymerase sigma factor (sigma-70 family)